MTTAGAALIGAKFGGPVGALIGGAIGFGAGVARLFMKSAEEKARQKIKAAYGLDVSDKGVLKQIVETAKSSFGGDLDTAIRSPQIKELLELYAMATGKPLGIQPRVRQVSLAQTSTGLYQNEIYENGRALRFAGLGTRTAADIIPSNPGSTGYQTNYAASMPVVVQATMKLDPSQTTQLWRGEVFDALAANPNAVQNAANKAQRGNYQRTEMRSNLLEPGVISR
jgi:hypothetical protein